MCATACLWRSQGNLLGVISPIMRALGLNSGLSGKCLPSCRPCRGLAFVFPVFLVPWNCLVCRAGCLLGISVPFPCPPSPTIAHWDGSHIGRSPQASSAPSLGLSLRPSFHHALTPSSMYSSSPETYW